MRGGQLIDSSVLDEPATDHAFHDMRVQSRSFEGPGDCLPSSIVKLILLLKHISLNVCLPSAFSSEEMQRFV